MRKTIKRVLGWVMVISPLTLVVVAGIARDGWVAVAWLGLAAIIVIIMMVGLRLINLI